MFPDSPCHGSILSWRMAETVVLGRHLVGRAAIDRVECFTALKRRSLNGPSQQGAQANSLRIHAHLCTFREGMPVCICHLGNWRVIP